MPSATRFIILLTGMGSHFEPVDMTFATQMRPDEIMLSRGTFTLG
jgi:hypothetical protein